MIRVLSSHETTITYHVRGPAKMQIQFRNILAQIAVIGSSHFWPSASAYTSPMLFRSSFLRRSLYIDSNLWDHSGLSLSTRLPRIIFRAGNNQGSKLHSHRRLFCTLSQVAKNNQQPDNIVERNEQRKQQNLEIAKRRVGGEIIARSVVIPNLKKFVSYHFLPNFLRRMSSVSSSI